MTRYMVHVEVDARGTTSDYVVDAPTEKVAQTEVIDYLKAAGAPGIVTDVKRIALGSPVVKTDE